MITLDTSGIVALLSVRDRHHDGARRGLEASGEPAVVPAMILTEVSHVVGARVGPAAIDHLLAGLQEGATYLDCGDVDVPRIRELMIRYADLPLGFADAAVVACAERSGGKVFTFDRRDFDVVAGDGLITVVP